MKIAIYGYGNLGKGVELAVRQNKDVELFGIFTRREPCKIRPYGKTNVYHVSEILNFKDKIDVLVICGGSATDLPVMTSELAKHFNVVDSFDNHPDIPKHFAKVNESSLAGGHTALISAGWDPGMFSLARLYSSVILPDGRDYTFWGRGVSQGHSDAIRQIGGVKDARQYTVPVQSALDSVRQGNTPTLSKGEMHTRECYVVVEELADRKQISDEIKNMPNYFSDYKTEVNFVGEKEFAENHSAMPHGGFVIRSGRTGLKGENKHTVEFSLKLDSNPEFTGNILVAFARAVYKMSKRGESGCKTVFDIPPSDISCLSREEILQIFL